MSSLRNAVERRNHKERGQPEERKKWGLLEKHKDYSARARDFNSKKKTLKALKQKAMDKNPDEFYHGMMSRGGPSTPGKHRNGTVTGKSPNKGMSQEEARNLKDKDLALVRLDRNKARKDLEKLQMRAIGIKGTGKKVVFVDDEEEQRRRANEDMDMDMDEEDDDEDSSDVEDDTEPDVTKNVAKNVRNMQKKEEDKLKTQLDRARERLDVLTEQERELELQKARMGKSPSRIGFTKNGVKYKIKQQRKR